MTQRAMARTEWQTNPSQQAGKTESCCTMPAQRSTGLD
jgi:hypothetical protein